MLHSTKRVFTLGVLVLVLAGCDSGDPATKYGKFKDEMCACKTNSDPTTCATRTNVAAKQYLEGLDEKAVTGEVEAKLETLENELGKCRDEVLGNE